MRMRDFRDLQVWRKAHELTLKIYKTTEKFPKAELYGLTSQLRRACASIATNIAEGCGRNSTKDLKRFFEIAQGSASEVEYQLQLACDLKYIDNEVYRMHNQMIEEIKKMLCGYVRQVKASNAIV